MAGAGAFIAAQMGLGTGRYLRAPGGSNGREHKQALDERAAGHHEITSDRRDLASLGVGTAWPAAE